MLSMLYLLLLWTEIVIGQPLRIFLPCVNYAPFLLGCFQTEAGSFIVKWSLKNVAFCWLTQVNTQLSVMFYFFTMP